MTFLFDLVILLVGAIIMGELFERLKLPALIGQLTAGILFGSVFGLVTGDSVTTIASLGVIILLFLVGLDFDLQDFIKNKKLAVLVPGLAFIIIMVGVPLISMNLFGFSLNDALMLSIILGSCSTPVTIKTMMELNSLKTRVGGGIITSTIGEDFYTFIMLSLLLSLAVSTESFAFIESLGKIFLFFAIFVILFKLLPKLLSKSSFLKLEEGEFSVIFIILLIMTLLAEELGLASITGAFFAGLVISFITTINLRRIHSQLSGITFGVFVPLFFAWAGTQLDLSGFAQFSWALIILPIAFIGFKLLGNYAGARISGFNNKESLGVGLGLMPRSEEQVLILIIAIQSGIFSSNATVVLFPVVVLTVLTTIFAGPLLMRRFIKNVYGTNSS